MLRDKTRWAKLQKLRWTIIPVAVDDVRREPPGGRIARHTRPRAYGRLTAGEQTQSRTAPAGAVRLCVCRAQRLKAP